MNEIICGDCIEEMKKLTENSVDSICCDPPYGLGFMGKEWDDLSPGQEVFEECLRVLKPGGHMLVFGGTRTYHRMVVAIEDAGFEVRDMIEWIYGSGFPKSHNIGKAVDKLQGNEREYAGKYQFPDGHKRTVPRVANKNTATPNIEGTPKQRPLTKGTSEYESWGTALKPAHEPICMARKPLSEKTVAENCLKWGTGGINIDQSRVGLNGERQPTGSGNSDKSETEQEWGFVGNGGNETSLLGRFPANLLLSADEDGQVSEEVRECFPDSKAGSYKGEGSKSGGIWSKSTGKPAGIEYGDSGNSSRFFKSIIYQPKASKKERNQGCEDIGGNKHCTVKPIALMEYLIKMITPKGGTVLDPFMGSGSTGVAAKKNGYDFIGIEREPEYCEIAEKRINSVHEPML